MLGNYILKGETTLFGLESLQLAVEVVNKSIFYLNQ